MNLVCDPADGVRKRLKDHDTSKPAVNQVHGVEGDTSQLDDGVVATSQEEERQHVHDRQNTGTVSNLCSNITAAPMDAEDTENDVHCQVT